MEGKKLSELSNLCISANDILQRNLHYQATPAADLIALYRILGQLPCCVSILLAYGEGRLSGSAPSSSEVAVEQQQSCRHSSLQLFRLVSDFVADILPYLFSAIEEAAPRDDGTGKTATDAAASGASLPNRRLPSLVGDGEVTKYDNEEEGVSREHHSSDLLAANEKSPSPTSVAPLVGACGTADSVWENIVGCEEAKAALTECTLLPKLFPQLFSRRRVFQRVLLYGPPGTGKTLLARAVAEGNQLPFLSFSAADLLSKWMGESEKHIQDLFVQASNAKNAILFFDEIDALCGTRGARDEAESSRRIKTQFLLQLQDLSPTVTIVAASNLPWEIDPAIRRRFDRMIYVGPPTREAKATIIRRCLQKVSHSLSSEDLDTLLDRMEDFTASDVVLVAEQAMARPLAAIVDARAVRIAAPEELASLNIPKHSPISDASQTHEGDASHSPESFTSQDNLYFLPCLSSDPRALTHVRPDHIPEQQLLLRPVGLVDFDEILASFIPSVSKATVEVFSQWGKSSK